MNEYFRNWEATAESLRDGWFHSLDIGFEQEEPEGGFRYFVITGRAKNMVKVRGESVSLEEMDRVLCNMSGIADAACIDRPHDLYGEEIIAVVAVSDETSDEQIRAHLLKHFSRASQPTRIVRRSLIPRTATGKVRRAVLREELDGMDH
jgi:acyl-CoA synthetase (AMP-forming)/AMP-acid ligase II